MVEIFFLICFPPEIVNPQIAIVTVSMEITVE